MMDCENCKWFLDERWETGGTDCECEDITEDELERYYTNAEGGCPHCKEKYPADVLAALEWR